MPNDLLPMPKKVNAEQPQPDQMRKDDLGGDSSTQGFAEFISNVLEKLGMGGGSQIQGPTMPNSTGALMPPGQQPNPLTQISLPQNPLGGGMTAPPPVGTPSAMIGGDNQNPAPNTSMASMLAALAPEGAAIPNPPAPPANTTSRDKSETPVQKVNRQGKGSKVATGKNMDDFLGALMKSTGRA